MGAADEATPLFAVVTRSAAALKVFALEATWRAVFCRRDTELAQVLEHLVDGAGEVIDLIERRAPRTARGARGRRARSTTLTRRASRCSS